MVEDKQIRCTDKETKYLLLESPMFTDVKINNSIECIAINCNVKISTIIEARSHWLYRHEQMLTSYLCPFERCDSVIKSAVDLTKHLFRAHKHVWKGTSDVVNLLCDVPRISELLPNPGYIEPGIEINDPSYKPRLLPGVVSFKEKPDVTKALNLWLVKKGLVSKCISCNPKAKKCTTLSHKRRSSSAASELSIGTDVQYINLISVRSQVNTVLEDDQLVGLLKNGTYPLRVDQCLQLAKYLRFTALFLQRESEMLEREAACMENKIIKRIDKKIMI